MSFNATQTVQELLDSIQKGSQAAVNLYCRKEASLDTVVTELEARLQPETIVMDVSSYAAFDDFVRDLIMRLLLREDKPENCRVADEAIEELNIRLLRRHVSRLLNAFSAQDSWICLILKHFEAVESYWDDSACAWMRELVDSGKIPACLILSAVPLSQVCDKPEGSSPLYNIFRVYPMEAEE